jgi:hypothetical protein
MPPTIGTNRIQDAIPVIRISTGSSRIGIASAFVRRKEDRR